MKIRVFTVDARDPAAGEEALNAFCASERVAEVERKFVKQGSRSFWTFCVTAVDGAASARAAASSRRDRVDYREVLSEADFVVFAQLRDIRKAQAQAEGVPPYALFTNDQLAAMVTSRVTSTAALEEVEGVGKSRAEKYAAHFLPVLQQAFAAAAAAGATKTN